MQKRQSTKFAALLSSAIIASFVPFASQAADVKEITAWDLQTQERTIGDIRAAMDRFEAENPGFKVVDSHFANDPYKTKLKIAFGANQPPCVFTGWGGGPLREYIKADQVISLTPYLDKNPKVKDVFMPASFSPVTYKDSIYGLPVRGTSIGVVLYNKEIFKDLDITPPKTWAELMDVVKVLNDHNIAPFALANKPKWPGSMFFVYLADRIGGPQTFLAAADRQPGGSFEDPVFIQAGKMLQDLVKADGFARGYNGLDYDIGGSRRLLYAGRAAMELMGNWEIGTIANENPEFMKKLDFFAFPAVEGGKGDPNDVVGTLGDNYVSISAACPYPDQAFKLLEKLTDEQSVASRLEDNIVSPVKGLKVSDPSLAKIIEFVSKAPSVQLWYDQELSPALAEVHKDTTQQLLGLSITPEKAAAAMEAAAQKAAAK
ncbi:extracellular solute-binding protein [Cohaesibacter celericrescens]|uniref:ABC transporter substrate-binding protein n=1 Tax=Cohaesibacter celericrescens TaxID=2067669 RepID=A0A2N5XNS2_9HYPH|nr:extracellular solute-binding protein [Cohaesibacter celericrescens]PLW76080.1 ABC transporter substrate-binding protein [Cohaesibacter celericrescens]